MGLESALCGGCGSMIVLPPSHNPIVDGPKVFKFKFPTEWEQNTLIKIVQLGAEEKFNNQPIQVQVIANKATIFNEVIPFEKIEQMNRTELLYVFVMNHYKPWLEGSAHEKSMLSMAQKWLVKSQMSHRRTQDRLAECKELEVLHTTLMKESRELLSNESAKRTRNITWRFQRIACFNSNRAGFIKVCAAVVVLTAFFFFAFQPSRS